ncbi:hypothetical protein T10_5454 [Trichinella papuae]|uniref:Uncharacterized protein n=2 Tax=Trichinella TaxID=6333 RepID=A0A0V1MBX6_9BILA|nr:hypothetical protein T10_5454 [Trichinella papuae]
MPRPKPQRLRLTIKRPENIFQSRLNPCLPTNSDDVLVASPNNEVHEKQYSVKRNLENCVCYVMNVGFLRFRVCSQGIKPLEKKLQLFVTSCDNRQPCMKFNSSSVVRYQSVRRGKAGTSEDDTVEPSTGRSCVVLSSRRLDGRWSTLAFFSQISVPLKQYRAFRRELLAFYLSLHHFQHWPEG